MKTVTWFSTIILLLFIQHLGLAQTNYTTVSGGPWSNAASWDTNGVPPSSLASTDTIFVKHNLTYNVGQVVLGVMIVESTGSIFSNSKSLKIGKGGTNQGVLLNYGNIKVKGLAVKPNNGCTPSILFPIIRNYGIITTKNNLQIGNNCGAGAFYNQIGGTVFVGKEVHVDNYLCNQDSMFVGMKVKNHGGFIDCCGYIETPLLDIDANSGRPGTFHCIDICRSDESDPIIDIADVIYDDLNDAYENAPASEVIIDNDSTFICSLDQAGMVSGLPVELSYFRAEAINNATILLSWQTATEINNDFFELQRSTDGKVWEAFNRVEGAGNSVSILNYQTRDDNPYFGVSYYRIKQIDFDGSSAYSSIQPVQIIESGNSKLRIFPNPANNVLTVQGNPTELQEIGLFNQYGQRITNSISIENTNDHVLELNISALPNGVYFLKTKTASAKFFKMD